MAALKLHAWRSGDRNPDKAGQDWLDIHKLVQLHLLDPNEESFASLILRYVCSDPRTISNSRSSTAPWKTRPAGSPYEVAVRAFEGIITAFKLREQPRPIEDIPEFKM